MEETPFEKILRLYCASDIKLSDLIDLADAEWMKGYRIGYESGKEATCGCETEKRTD